MRWKRPLFLLHRWAGIVLCLFFALWFVSGLFMMYVEFPQLTKPERFAGAPSLDISTATLSPGAAVERLTPQDFTTAATPSDLQQIEVADTLALRDSLRSVRLTMVLGRPAYVVHLANGSQPRVVFADTGEVLRAVTAATGTAAAAQFAARSGQQSDRSKVTFAEQVQTDQWTVSSALNDHRPLLRYTLHDDARTELYVSSTTGEVVRDTHRSERLLNYLGAVTHWLYPTFVRKYPLLWEWIVDVLSGAGVILAISGMWIGLLRWNRRAKPGKNAVPYRGLMRWHYFAGISFGIVTITWVMSGLLSMNPLNLNPSRRPLAEQELTFTGKALTPSDFTLPADGFGAGSIDAELIHYSRQPFYRVSYRDTSVRLIAGSARATQPPRAEVMMARAAALIPSASIADARVLTAFDNYYYSRHPGRGERTLPMIRVQFEDAQHTWFHLDPLTGQIVDRMTRVNRAYRWLYNGLHSWDIWWLWQRRPLWDIVVIAFSLGGTTLSMLGVVIGWRRLNFRSGKARAAGVKAMSTATLDIAQ